MKKYNKVICIFLLMTILGLTACGPQPQTEVESSQMESSQTEQTKETQSESSTQPQTAETESSEQQTQEETDGMLQTAVEVGCLAPDITLNYLDGEHAQLSDYKGKAVLLNLWATWCGPCVGELPAFTMLEEEFGDQLQIIALNCGDSKRDVEHFIDENGYTFAVALDPEYRIMIDTYRTSSIPYTVIIDSQGVITHIQEGARDAQTMFETYKSLIEEAIK